MQKKNPREIRDSRADGYKIIFDKGFSPRKSIINSIWGVYYGDTLYINRMFYQGEKGFDKVYCLGSYGYFHGINPNPATSSDYNTALMSGFLFGAVGGAIAGAATDNNSRTGKFPRVMIYLIDLETGMVSPLTSFKLEKILEDDQELLDSYNKEKYKTSMMIMHAYLDTYAERRKNR
jgi:hypothetical protein